MRLRMGVTAVAVTALALGLAGGAQGGFGQIAVNDDSYSPDDIEVGTGGAEFTFAWGTVNNEHNVRADRKIFYSGPITSDDNEAFGVKLTAGRYHFYCENHGSADPGAPNNMDGRIDVTPGAVDGPGDTVRVYFGDDSPGYVGNQFDVRYRINGGQFKFWKQNTRARRGLFGKRNRPVDFDPSKTYEVQVRSELHKHPKRRSAFSPSRFFGAP